MSIPSSPLSDIAKHSRDSSESEFVTFTTSTEDQSSSHFSSSPASSSTGTPPPSEAVDFIQKIPYDIDLLFALNLEKSFLFNNKKDYMVSFGGYYLDISLKDLCVRVTTCFGRIKNSMLRETCLVTTTILYRRFHQYSEQIKEEKANLKQSSTIKKTEKSKSGFNLWSRLHEASSSSGSGEKQALEKVTEKYLSNCLKTLIIMLSHAYLKGGELIHFKHYSTVRKFLHNL